MDETKQPPHAHHEDEPLLPTSKKMNTKVIIIGVGLLLLLLLGGYFLVGSKGNNENAQTEQEENVGEEQVAPALETSEGMEVVVASPVHGDVVESAEITVSGSTSPNADVFINETELKADASGNFSTSITLDEGENTISIAANDTDGNYAESEISVTYSPSEEL